MRRNTISGCLLESVSLGKIPLRESQSNWRKDTLNYDLNYIDYPYINHKMLTYFWKKDNRTEIISIKRGKSQRGKEVYYSSKTRKVA